MSLPYNDGALPYGSRVITINTVDYIAEQIEITRPTNVLERRNELNVPSGQVLLADFATGSATLQLASATTAVPENGKTFASDFGAGSETWVISEVSKPEAQGDIKKVSVKFRKVYNP